MERIKISVKVDALVSGMVMAESVINDYGAVVLWQDITLEDHHIERLIMMGIHQVWVYADTDVMPQTPNVDTDIPVQKHSTILDDMASEEHLAVGSPPASKEKIGVYAIPLHVEQMYLHDTLELKNLFKTLAEGKKPDAGMAQQIVSDLLSSPMDNRNIIECVMEVRPIDEYTYCHSINVSMLSMMLGRWMKLDDRAIRNLVHTGLLHDIGKSRVPLRILNKPGKLTDAEFAEMKKHTEYGYIIAKEIIGTTHECLFGILSHHEREDGTGYPLGLNGPRLHMFAKILAVVDVFDAMTAKRVYKTNESPFTVFEMMQNDSFGLLDSKIMSTFLENITNYYVGKQVRMSDGTEGEVVFMNKLDYSKPVVRVGERFIDLMSERTLRVSELM